MAKSFFTQILDLAGISLPDPNTQHDDPSKYRQSAETNKPPSSSGLTRVEQYLQKKNPQPKMTRVEQYLAKKQAALQAETAEETPESAVEVDDSQLTGVARYLARKQASQQTPEREEEPAPKKPMTRVEKYLAQKKTAPSKPKPAPSVKKTAPTRAPTTGVDKYLSRKKSVPVAAAKKEIAETAKPEEKQLIEVSEPKKPAAASETKSAGKSTAQKPKEPAKKTAPSTSKSASVIDHAENADQCQAATQKGSRCRRKSNLEVLTKTINKQKYRFAVCHQHNNSDFVPFEEFAPQS